MASLVEVAVDIGLDSFTLVEVAARAGVGESTVYGYVGSRADLYTAAAAAVLDELDVDVEASSWTDYVDEVSQRCFDLAKSHPGLRDYVLYGPFEPSTVRLFETLIARVRRWLPEVSEHTAFLLASRPLVSSLSHLGDPVLEPVATWLRQAMLRGLDEMVRTGPPPDPGAPSWRTKLRTVD